MGMVFVGSVGGCCGFGGLEDRLLECGGLCFWSVLCVDAREVQRTENLSVSDEAFGGL